MSIDFWQKIEEIFPLVADLPAPEREKRLRELCAGDENLRREISDLLAADEKAANFCEAPAVMPSSLSGAFFRFKSEKPKTLELEGQAFGAYRVVRKIGSGGMGAIYLAVRADGEFDKEVAVKLVKNGSDTEFNLRRFRRERQILARLEHPNIARLIDGGTTDEGTPYFVMEYVVGKPLFDYCRASELDLPAKLHLFRQICAAVAYAHERSVVHRDLKPGNILVTENGTIKLLDFGIAKIFDADSVHNSNAQTKTLMRQMTPEYASPEQIKGERITPASDVYSLGVILYELLTGERPYKFLSRSPHEIARIVCEEQVRSPKINIKNPLSDDLKFIVLKSLQKEASERYADVADFDRDISKFLEGIPILTEETRLKFFEKSVGNSENGLVSLAVAPFQILTAENAELYGAKDSSDDFLGIGLADALTTRLSGVRQLSLRPTSSVLRLASETQDAQELGRQLSTDYVLTGHILRVGANVRTSVQLLKTQDNSVLWAQHFDESERDVFRLQDLISERVAASLVPQITTEEQEILRRKGTSNAAAYEAYLRGRVSYHNYTFSGVANAEKYFKEAIAYDPNFALAHSGLADFYNLQTIVGSVSNHEGFNHAKKSALKAIELDPNLAEAYTALGFAACAYDWDFAEAERLFQKAIRLNPNYQRAYEWYAFLLSLSERHDEAIEKMRQAERLDLNSPATLTMFSLILYNARCYEESLEKARRSLELDPNYYIALQSLGWICPRLGKFDEAIAGCRRAVRLNDEQALNKLSLALALIDSEQITEARAIAAEIEARRRKEKIPAYFSALIYANLGEDKKAFYWLDRAIVERGYWTLRMRIEPRFDCLRSDPRFAATLEKIKPLETAKATDNNDIRSPGNPKPAGRFKTRTAFAAAAALICVLIIVVTANFKINFFQKDVFAPDIAVLKEDQPPNQALTTIAPIEKDGNKPRTADAVADGLYLAGKQQLGTRSKDGINKAIEFFNEAAKRDPNFALAFSGLADAHILFADKQEDSATAYRKAEEFAVKALALEPDLAEARISLGMAKFRNTGDFNQAEKHFLRAIEINPSSATAHHWYSVILEETGKIDDAIREIEIAARLDSRSSIILHSAATLYMQVKRYDEAHIYFDRAIENDNGFIPAYFWKSLLQQYQNDYDAALETYRKARIYGGNDENDPLWLLMQAQAAAFNGRRSEAQKFLNRYLNGEICEKNPEGYANEVALVYNLLGDTTNAFAWLEKIKLKSGKGPGFMIADQRFANLHSDVRYIRLAEKWQNFN